MKRLWGAMLLAVPGVGAAQDEPRFCPSRPSLESSACTTEPGRVHLEISAMDWQLDRGDGERTDTFLPGDFLLRAGIGATTEVQLGWSPLGIVRERADGTIGRRTRVGDMRLAVRHAFAGADGKGLSYGMEPFVTVPVGRRPVGDGDWGAGVVLPVTWDLNDALTLGATAEVDAAVDQDGSGRHLAGNGAAGVTIALTQALALTLEGQWLRDDDPAGATTQWFSGTGLTWDVGPTRALYAEAVAGLNHDAPDMRLYGGIAVLF